jgi:hypothetical protein
MGYCGAFCPTISQNQAQNNAVVSSQKEMDRVGFEPTTSASMFILSLNQYCLNKSSSNPTRSII